MTQYTAKPTRHISIKIGTPNKNYEAKHTLNKKLYKRIIGFHPFFKFD